MVIVEENDVRVLRFLEIHFCITWLEFSGN